MQGKASKEASSNGSAKENACKHRAHTGKQSMQKERKEKRRRKEAGEREREKTRKRERKQEEREKEKETEKEKEKEKEKEGGETEWPRISRLLCHWDRKALASMRAPAQTSICGSLVKEGKAAQASAGTILPT